MSLTLRASKGSALTQAEMDANFSGLADGTLLSGISNSSGSSLVGFVHDVTGAVARTAQSKLRELGLSPIDAGATFDSIIDTTTAIQNCFNDGRPCYLPPGTANVTSNLNLTTAASHGQILYGAGPTSNTGTGTNKTIIKPSAAVTGGLFKIDGSGIGLSIQGWKFRDFTIDMTNMTDVSTNYGIRQMGAYGGNYDNIQVINDGSNKRGFKFETGAYTTVLNNCKSNLIEAAGTSLVNAVTTLSFNGCAFAKFIGSQCVSLTFLHPIVQGALDKFDLTSISGITILSGDIEGTGNYLKVTGAAVSHVHSNGNEFSGFSGTYLSGTPASSQLQDFYGSQGFNLTGVSGGSATFSVTDFAVSFVKSAAALFRTTFQNSNVAAQQIDLEVKNALGSIFVGQTATGGAYVDNRSGTKTTLQVSGTDKFGISGDKLLSGTLTQSTVGAAGVASALPATPSGYLRIVAGGTELVIPLYAQA